MDWIDARLVFLISHLFGVAIGAGAAFTGDIIFLTSVKKRILTKAQSDILDITGRVVWLGLLILLISGIGLVLQHPEIYLQSDKFWAKMTIVLIIALNGLAFHFIHRPSIKKSVDKSFSQGDEIIKKRIWIVLSGALSITSWSFVIVLGASHPPYSYIQIVGFYLLFITFAFLTAVLAKNAIISAVKS